MSTTRLRATADGLRRSPRALVDAASKAAAKELRRTLRTDAGGDFVLSGIPKARLRVKVDVRDFGREAVAELTPGGNLGSSGVWAILESGADPHTIPRGGRRRRMRLPNGWVIGPVDHPGAPPKRTWSRAIPPAIEAAQREARRTFTKEVN